MHQNHWGSAKLTLGWSHTTMPQPKHIVAASAMHTHSGCAVCAEQVSIICTAKRWCIEISQATTSSWTWASQQRYASTHCQIILCAPIVFACLSVQYDVNSLLHKNVALNISRHGLFCGVTSGPTLLQVCDLGPLKGDPWRWRAGGCLLWWVRGWIGRVGT